MSDIERNLLKQFTDDEGFETAIFLTYGVDLAFFETALLSPLRSNNCRNHLIFVEAERYEDTLHNLRGSFSWVGSRYVLVPVQLSNGLFHPKIALLIGPNQGRLFVGSGNLTFSGYGSNRELFTRLDWKPELDAHHTLFSDVWRFVRTLSSRFSNQQASEIILGKTERRARWLSNSGDEQTAIRFLHNLDRPLLDQIAAHFEGQEVRKATFMAPFFSSTQLRAMMNALMAKETTFIVQPGRVRGDQSGLTKLANEDDTISLARFQNEDRYVHAKAYVFETTAGSTAITGSPNCSVAALGRTATDGNIEAAILTQHPEPKHFEHLYANGVEPVEANDVAALPLDDRQPAVRDQRRQVVLLDATENANQIYLRFMVVNESDKQFSLIAQFTGETISLVPLGNFANGEHTTIIEAGDGTLFDNAGPVSVCLEHEGDRENGLNLNCNELWLARLDALRSAATRAVVGGHSAAEALLGLGNSDVQWQALHKVLSQLLDDEMERISKGGSSSGTKKGGDKRAAKSEDDEPIEDKVVIIDVEAINSEEEAAERLREELEEESEFGDFLNLVLGLMPGKERNGVSTDGNEPNRQYTGKRTPWTMERRIRRRLTGVLHKYIRSLGNPRYLPELASTAIARDLVVFLLFAHRLYLEGVLDSDEYKIQLTELLSTFFGKPLAEAPIQSALHEGVLRSSVADIWREKQVPSYVLASLFNLRATTGKLRTQYLSECSIRSLTGLAVIVGNLDAIAEDTASLLSAAERMEIDGESLIVGVEEMIDEARPRLIETLEAWLPGAVIATISNDDLPSEDPVAAYRRGQRSYQANIDYRTALFHLYRGEQDSLQRRLDMCEELSFWNRRYGRVDEASKWDERLVALAEAEGDVGQLAEALFQQGKQLFFQREYKIAVSRLRQAETLAETNGLETVSRHCKRYIDNARFFLR